MLIIGLTGSIGMGKSTTANFFRNFGIPVHDADLAVHELYEGKAAPLIEQAFPNTVNAGKVDRNALFLQVANNPEAMNRLEAIIHPLVKQHRDDFVFQAVKAGTRALVLDIPLLFEIGADKQCDVVVVVTAPESVQKQRVMARTGMTETRFQAILEKQMPDIQKRKRAHFIIDTGRGLKAAQHQVNGVLRSIMAISGHKFKGKS